MTATIPTLKAPFPWFGGKSRVAPLMWSRFGDVANYVEPFFGSGAVLLGRPHAPLTETVNDKDAYLANFWRALRADADAVAEWAGDPIHEADLLARHRWLVGQAEFRDRMRSDPDYHDAKIAGWWVWGLCLWIGSGFCREPVADKLPHLGNAGQGIHRKLPHLGDAGRDGLREYLGTLSARLSRVRVACGEWDRVLGDSVTWRHGMTGVLLDPPYDENGHDVDYSAGGNVAGAVGEWARENGAHPLLRIALCGYDGAYDLPGWECVAWKTRGGFGSQSDGRGRENARRERVWFSPACLSAEQSSLDL